MDGTTVIIRDARPEEAPFLAKCIMAGMKKMQDSIKQMFRM